MEVTMDRNMLPPNSIFQSKAPIKKHSTVLLIKANQFTVCLALPVKGSEWLAADGPGNDESNHHRHLESSF